MLIVCSIELQNYYPWVYRIPIELSLSFAFEKLQLNWLPCLRYSAGPGMVF